MSELPPLKFWIEPMWKTEDEDYVALIVRHPMTRATIRIGVERYAANRDGDLKRAQAVLIDRANAAVPT